MLEFRLPMRSSQNYLSLLNFRGFQPFLYAQFLGALNDNLLKIVVSMFAIHADSATNRDSTYLSLAGAVFILPFILFSGYAGFISDRFNKRSVIIATKSTEIIATSAGTLALISGHLEWMLLSLFLMALHSTFFSPAKYGILPEMVPFEDLSRANGLLEMTTFLAIILGTSVGGFLFARFHAEPFRIGLILTGLAILGTGLSFGTRKVPFPDTRPLFYGNPWREILAGTRELYRDRSMAWIVRLITLFWFLGALLQMNILLFGREAMNLGDFRIALFGAFLALGIGGGSLVAGTLSKGRIALGLTPIGLCGLSLLTTVLSVPGLPYPAVALILVLLGGAGGLYIVPLNSYLQAFGPPEAKGRTIATNNFYNMGGVLLASGALWLLKSLFHFTPREIFLLLGLLLTGTTYILITLKSHLFRKAAGLNKS